MKEGAAKIINSKSKTFLAFCFCFIVGVGLFSLREWDGGWLFGCYILSFIGLLSLIIFWARRSVRFILWCVLFFLLGAMRFLFSVPAGDQLWPVNGEQQELRGVISEEPEIGDRFTRYILRTDRGGILLELPTYRSLELGQRLSVRCGLRVLDSGAGETFNYRAYWARRGVWRQCEHPKIISSQAPTMSLRRGLLWLKLKVSTQVERLWPEPESSLMAGLLYGARGGLPAELLDDFSRVGITHIIAISGYNISIVAVVLMTTLVSVGLYRHQAFWLAVSGIMLFVLFTGASASVVRAGIMGIIVLLAQQLGRLSRIGNALVFTAALMLLANPWVLIWDAGFQLSFLATAGLVYLMPLFERWPEIIGSTMSAIIATLPLILFQFGRLSLAAPLANLLILWLIPYLMFFGFAAILISLIFHPLGLVISWVAGMGLRYVIMVASGLGSLPWVAVDLSIPWWGMVGAYFLLYIFLARRNLGVGGRSTLHNICQKQEF